MRTPGADSGQCRARDLRPGAKGTEGTQGDSSQGATATYRSQRNYRSHKGLLTQKDCRSHQGLLTQKDCRSHKGLHTHKDCRSHQGLQQPQGTNRRSPEDQGTKGSSQELLPTIGPLGPRPDARGPLGPGPGTIRVTATLVSGHGSGFSRGAMQSHPGLAAVPNTERGASAAGLHQPRASVQGTTVPRLKGEHARGARRASSALSGLHFQLERFQPNGCFATAVPRGI